MWETLIPLFPQGSITHIAYKAIEKSCLLKKSLTLYPTVICMPRAFVKHVAPINFWKRVVAVTYFRKHHVRASISEPRVSQKECFLVTRLGVKERGEAVDFAFREPERI